MYQEFEAKLTRAYAALGVAAPSSIVARSLAARKTKRRRAQATDGDDQSKPLFVVGVTTWNRLEYLERFVQTFDATRSNDFRWALIIADDGSTDGTVEYMSDLAIDNCQVITLYNKRATVAGQTNTILVAAQALGFDFGMKCDDDIFFAADGWDKLYYEVATESGYPHLVYHNEEWKPATHRKIEGLLHSHVVATNAMGCLWTFTPEVIDSVGYFDEPNFRLRGHAHLDYTLRCCRAGFNDAGSLWDAAGAPSAVTMWPRENYIETIDFKSAEVKAILTPEERRRRSALILEKDRGHIALPSTRHAQPRTRFDLSVDDTKAAEALVATGIFVETTAVTRTVDAVMVLNLDHDRVKWARTAARLAAHGIVAERFSAVNGNLEEHYAEWAEYESRGLELEIERKIGRRLIASAGALGYLKTMRELLQSAIDRRLSSVLVFDDDVLLDDDFGTSLGGLLAGLPSTWRTLHLGTSSKATKTAPPAGPGLMQAFSPVDGSFACLVRSTVFRELIDEIDLLDSPYDSGPLSRVIAADTSSSFIARPAIAVADVESSDLRLSRSMDNFSQKAGWEINRFTASYNIGGELPAQKKLPEQGRVTVVVTIGPGTTPARATLDSLRGQTHPNLELLLVDHTGTTANLELLEVASDLDSRVSYFMLPAEAETVDAQNFALHFARGEFVSFASHSAIFDARHFEVLTQTMREGSAWAVKCRSVDHSRSGAALQEPAITAYLNGMARASLFATVGDLLDAGDRGIEGALERSDRPGGEVQQYSGVLVAETSSPVVITDSGEVDNLRHSQQPRPFVTDRGWRPQYRKHKSFRLPVSTSIRI